MALIGAVAGAAFASPAAATTVYLKTFGPAFKASTIVDTYDGVELTQIAGSWQSDSYDDTSMTGMGTLTPGGPDGNAEFHVSVLGTGIYSEDADHYHKVDGKGPDADLAIFSFDQAVTLDWMKFNYVDHNDDVAFFFGDSIAGLKNYSVMNILKSAPKHLGKIDFGITAKVFAFGAVDKHDNFKFKKLSFSEAPPPDPIPLPGGVVLMMTGIASFIFVRLRKQTARLA